MLTRLLSNQIPEYENVINETIDQSIPDVQETTRTKLFEQLLLGTAQCWISTRDDQFEAIVITRVTDDIAMGGKTCTILCTYAPGGAMVKSFTDGFEAVSKFAKAQDCDRMDFFTDNDEIIKYAKMFPLLWETSYFQIKL